MCTYTCVDPYEHMQKYVFACVHMHLHKHGSIRTDAKIHFCIWVSALHMRGNITTHAKKRGERREQSEEREERREKREERREWIG